MELPLPVWVEWLTAGGSIVVGVIGKTLGDHQVNIANMHLSRTRGRDKAIGIIQMDEVDDI